MVVEAQSLGVGVEEGGPFQAEGVGEEGPYPAVEEQVQNPAGEEVVEEAAAVDKVQTWVRVGEAVVVVEEEEEQHPLVKVVAVELDGRCSVASVGTCRQSSL